MASGLAGPKTLPAQSDPGPKSILGPGGYQPPGEAPAYRRDYMSGSACPLFVKLASLTVVEHPSQLLTKVDAV